MGRADRSDGAEFYWELGFVLSPASNSTSTSLLSIGLSTVVVLPPGHLTQTWLGSDGVPSTGSGLSCDQNPDPP